MKTTVLDICKFMDAWAPPEWAYSWDRVGLHTGSRLQPVATVLVCLTITPEAVLAAKDAGADMIISHHPLIWTPLAALNGDDPRTRMCLDLCNAGIACFSAHTNLDVAPGGVNAALAAKLKLTKTQVLFHEEHLRQVKLITFAPEAHRIPILNALAATGAGVIGEYTHCSFGSPGTGTFLPGKGTTPFSGQKGKVNEEPEIRLEILADKGRLATVLEALLSAHPYEEPAFDIIPLSNVNKRVGLGLRGELKKRLRLKDFAAFVRKNLAVPQVKVYGRANKCVQQVAVLGGSGGSHATQIPEDVDVYITGDVGYHDAEAAVMRGISCIDAGHTGTELPVVNVIARRLRAEFAGLKISIFKEKEASFVVARNSP